jgi:hypothetical protein
MSRDAAAGTNIMCDRSGKGSLHRVGVKGRVRFRRQGARQMRGGTGEHESMESKGGKGGQRRGTAPTQK